MDEDIGNALEKEIENMQRNKEYVERMKDILKEIVETDMEMLGDLDHQIANATVVQSNLVVALVQLLNQVIIEYIQGQIDTGIEDFGEDDLAGYQ